MAAAAISSASAAPRYPFPASRYASADWWKTAARVPLTDPDHGRLSFGWDADNLYLHLSGAAQAGTIALQVPAGERRLTWKNGTAQVTQNGKTLEATVTFVNGGKREMDAAIRWSALGQKPGTAGSAFPLSVAWGSNGAPTRWLPETPVYPNPLTWGALYLNDGEPLSECAPTLTRPFMVRFDPTHSKAVLKLTPEPVSGLAVPVEVTERVIAPAGGTDRVVRTRVSAHDSAFFEITAPRDAAAVSMTLRIPMFNGSVPENEYRTLPSTKPLDQYAGAPGWNPPDYFDSYWARARADLAKTPMNARISEVKERNSATGRLYRVELDSLDNVGIVCWYFVPKDVDTIAGTSSRKYPAVQIMPGYGSEEPPIDRTADGYITLGVNPRGHGPSAAFWPLPGDHLNWNINDPEKYYYRGAYMDCVRAMQFLMDRPEVDTARVGVEGSSQGGALALATAALDSRVAACSANVPFLCDFPSAVVLCTRGGLSGLRSRFEADTAEGAAVRKSLSYIDATFMATRIHCPTLVAIAQMDRTCPPHGGAAAINRMPKGVERQLLSVPIRDHEVMPEWREASEAWFAKHLKR